MLMSPIISNSFGPDSAARHEAEALRLGLTTARVELPGTGFDLDADDDYQLLRELDPGVFAELTEPIKIVAGIGAEGSGA